MTAGAPSLSAAIRDEVRATDPPAVRALVRATGFFSDEEIAVAGELVEERLQRGPASGYHFLFAEAGLPSPKRSRFGFAQAGGALAGYACFGPIPLTRSSFDLYWIVVHPDRQGAGLGRRLLALGAAAAFRQGGARLYAETSSRPHYAPTRAFYRAAGFDPAAELADFYAPGDAKLVFAKLLTPAP